MNPLKDAIKGRRIQIALMVSPEGEVTIEQPGEELPPDVEANEEMQPEQVMDAGSDDSDMEEAQSPGEVKLSPKDLMRAKQLIASGKEPTSITDKMLIEQYNQQEG